MRPVPTESIQIDLDPKIHSKKKAGRNSGTYMIMCIIMSLTLLLNMNQMYRLESEDSPPTIIITEKINNNLSSYFQEPRRKYIHIPKRKDGIQKNLVKAGDSIIYKSSSWDSAPVVIEQYKLIFFTIPKCGCTVWKQLFRRMMGYSDWVTQDGDSTLLPHNADLNGLKYLYDYSVEAASEMMTSSEWTRAIMIREPKQRFLSAFLDKAVSNEHKHIIDHCCPEDGSLLNPQFCLNAEASSSAFLKLAEICDDDHWRPQHERMESKYWPYIDVVLHVESAFQDTKKLLQRIGAWDDYGASGWGQKGNLPIFGSKETQAAGQHATWANWQHWKWYTPDIEEEVERFYRADYENPLFNFTAGVCLTCTMNTTE